MHDWSKDLGILHFQKTFSNITGGKAGLAINIYSGHLKSYSLPLNERNRSDSVIITVTTSSLILMKSGDIYQGALKY